MFGWECSLGFGMAPTRRCRAVIRRSGPRSASSARRIVWRQENFRMSISASLDTHEQENRAVSCPAGFRNRFLFHLQTRPWSVRLVGSCHRHLSACLVIPEALWIPVLRSFMLQRVSWPMRRLINALGPAEAAVEFVRERSADLGRSGCEATVPKHSLEFDA